MNESPYRQTRSRLVAAAPREIFELLRDPAMHPVIDGSGTVRASNGQGSKLTLGSEFGMQMRLGIPYRISNTVVEFEQDRQIAWRHFSGHRWRYELEAVGSGTLVSETWDASRLRHKWPLRLMGFTRSTGPNMERTLERLAAQFPDATE
ncbi:polyketide cyclase / dehydrase and lipid transport [Glutamicibacter sp. BW80]|uniref:SRPBCC family protein n=1 Tax=Glutamicibacter sp. BW80 TaxID=2024404 RepID=UPI000BB88132|nr:SRPBCC family protein [Glutamicibacter sp. BW80]PCC27554.1 polyketide cyclase / dehydrase and lipid transport [Glutamicibacter sp. BW80]